MSASFLDARLSGVVHPTFPFIAGREYLGVKDLSQNFQTFDDAGPWAVEILIAVGDEDAIVPARPSARASRVGAPESAKGSTN